jgi:hypothetical protein
VFSEVHFHREPQLGPISREIITLNLNDANRPTTLRCRREGWIEEGVRRGGRALPEPRLRARTSVGLFLLGRPTRDPSERSYQPQVPGEPLKGPTMSGVIHPP